MVKIASLNGFTFCPTLFRAIAANLCRQKNSNMTSVKIAKDTSLRMRANSVLKTKVQQMAAEKGLTVTEYVTQLILADLRREDVTIELTAKLV